MRPSTLLCLGGTLLTLTGGPTEAQGPRDAPRPPVAKLKPKTLVNLGHSRVDNYYWLNQRDNPEVIDYLKAENEYTAAVPALEPISIPASASPASSSVASDPSSGRAGHERWYPRRLMHRAPQAYARHEPGSRYAIAAMP